MKFSRKQRDKHTGAVSSIAGESTLRIHTGQSLAAKFIGQKVSYLAPPRTHTGGHQPAP